MNKLTTVVLDNNQLQIIHKDAYEIITNIKGFSFKYNCIEFSNNEPSNLKHHHIRDIKLKNPLCPWDNKTILVLVCVLIAILGLIIGTIYKLYIKTMIIRLTLMLTS